MRLSSILIAPWIYIASAQNISINIDDDLVSSWSGCVNPNDPTAKVLIGQKTPVCFLIGNGLNWAAGVDYIRLSFTPIADQYSKLTVPNSYVNLVQQSTDTIWASSNVTIAANSQQALSFLRQYYEPDRARIYPFLTAIIDVKDGVVQYITWDNSCVFCSPNECDEITYNFNGVQQTQASSGQPTGGCHVEEEQCNSLGNSTSCDLTLFVVWTGTDARGRTFQSSSSRFSAFPPQDIQDRIRSFFDVRRLSTVEEPEF